MEDEKIYCSHCGVEVEEEDCSLVSEDILCPECVDRYTVTCDRCSGTIYDADAYSDENTCVCRRCYENYYSCCEECDSIIHNDDSYEYEGGYYCYDCYQNLCKDTYIYDYSYKPEPVFYGDDKRYFGVELEIDIAGKDNGYAEELLDIANISDNCIYIKSDSSLTDGMEIVSHPMTLDFHKDFCWEDVMHHAVNLGYRSHQTSTCGLHIHVNRDSLADSREEQDDIISRILYFVEHHWNEMLKFSRRSEYAMNRWAARYGYENSPKAIMDKAKKNYGRYSAVNLCNYHTVEFRMFRGTLKYNTFIAALQLVNEICNVAIFMSDEELQGLSWSDFVEKLTESELIQYLKERKLYINEEITTEEDL